MSSKSAVAAVPAAGAASGQPVSRVSAGPHRRRGPRRCRPRRCRRRRLHCRWRWPVARPGSGCSRAGAWRGASSAWRLQGGGRGGTSGRSVGRGPVCRDCSAGQPGHDWGEGGAGGWHVTAECIGMWCAGC
eukprot:361197-Chlamydomonas_euryale.AAC.8